MRDGRTLGMLRPVQYSDHREELLEMLREYGETRSLTLLDQLTIVLPTLMEGWEEAQEEITALFFDALLSRRMVLAEEALFSRILCLTEIDTSVKQLEIASQNATPAIFCELASWLVTKGRVTSSHRKIIRRWIKQNSSSYPFATEYLISRLEIQKHFPGGTVPDDDEE